MSQQDQKPTDAAQHTHILVVDDELFIRNALELYFETHGFGVSTANTGDLALEMVAKREVSPDLVLLDLMMPGTPGMDVLIRFKEIDPSIEVIIATGCGGMNTAVEALKHGAFDYITKPILDFDRDLLKTVERALDARRFNLETEPNLRKPENVETFPDDSYFAENESDRSHWLHAFEQINELVDEHGGRPLDEAGLRAVWGLLHEGLGADAALVIHEGTDDKWAYEQSWGFLSPPRPRDLWQSAGPDPANGGSGTKPLRLWDLSGQPISTQFARKWSKVLHIPFQGKHDEPLLLLLFYRNDHPFGRPGSPLPLLAATLSWLFRATDPDGRPAFSTSDFDSISSKTPDEGHAERLLEVPTPQKG